MHRRKLIKIAALGGVAVAGCVGVAHAAPRRLRVTRHRVRMGTAQTIRVAHLTHLHIGWGTPDHLVEQAVELTLRARPHLVVLTGDYLNRSLTHGEKLRSFVARLPRPCVATLGNHDHWSGAAEIMRILSSQGLEVLRNERTIVSMRGGRLLEVVGVDDGVTKHHDVGRAFDGIHEARRALALTHDPRTANAIASRGARLILAGHTHGGQLDIPLVTKSIFQLAGMHYIAGWYRLGRARLYVSAGVGSSVVRVRAGKKGMPELALFELC